VDGDRGNYDTKNVSLVFQQRPVEGVYLELGGPYDKLTRENFESPAAENLANQVRRHAPAAQRRAESEVGLP